MKSDAPEYCYKNPLAEKHFKVNTLKNVPLELTEYFKEFSIRIHRDENYEGYFFLTLAVPSKRDDQDYVWENLLHSKQNNDDYTYSVPHGELTTEALMTNLSFSFEPFIDTRSGEHFILLNASISGTPYLGNTLFNHDSFYELGEYKEY